MPTNIFILMLMSVLIIVHTYRYRLMHAWDGVIAYCKRRNWFPLLFEITESK